ncbi:hypothetical protein ASG17_07515 [Brevundimonas sp. Leaf363]|uniref:hypothetical protein n=1 Tax=Brevundimonas sp. Leaf363 TaxID=1736353 RepID=UPI0006F4DDA5|nr:hypothetical protein [Brevundimonas sp. Leaf363]KQS55889.1 hypothetical protein ASG17_07515 [Brevundimonas sp. Leaf363]
MSVKTFVAQRLLPLLARLDLLEAGSSAANAALFLASSTTSNAIGTGQKTFTTQSGKAFVAGQFVQVSDQANPANYMLGQVSSYSGTSLVVDVVSVGGSGTKTAWNIALSGPGGATGGISGGTLTGDLGDAPEVTVASAATTNIGAANSNKVVVSGNVTITAFDSVANRRKLLRFTGTPLLTHGANLILPGAADMQMAAGDLAEFSSDGSGVWRMRKYQSVSESNYGRSLLSTAGAVAARAILAALGLAGEEATEVDVASAATTDIGAAASNKVRITGTTTITSLGAGANLRKRVRFASALTLTHNGTSLILPGGANLLTAAGDIAIFESNASGNWRLVSWTRAASLMAGGVGPFASIGATVDLGLYPSHFVVIGGSTATIAALGSSASLAEPFYFARFNSGHTLTHNATSLILPGGKDLTLEVGDFALFEYLGGGNWRLNHLFRASGWAGAGRTGQIAFPAAQLASTDPNTLDDYEEGAWTPSIVTDGTTPTDAVYAAANAGGYIKVGKLWIYWGRVALTSKGTGGTGNVRIGGLPAASAADAAVTVSRATGLTLTASNILTATVSSNQFRMEQSGASGYSNLPWSSITDGFNFVFAGVFVGAN